MGEPEEALPPDVWIIATLKEMLETQMKTNEQLQSVQNEVNTLRTEQRSAGVLYPVVQPVTDEGVSIKPGETYKMVSIYNRGDDDCTIRLKISGRPKTQKISLLSKVSKVFEFNHDLITSVSAKCATGESCTLELEFKR